MGHAGLPSPRLVPLSRFRKTDQGPCGGGREPMSGGQRLQGCLRKRPPRGQGQGPPLGGTSTDLIHAEVHCSGLWAQHVRAPGGTGPTYPERKTTRAAARGLGRRGVKCESRGGQLGGGGGGEAALAGGVHTLAHPVLGRSWLGCASVLGSSLLGQKPGGRQACFSTPLGVCRSGVGRETQESRTGSSAMHSGTGRAEVAAAAAAEAAAAGQAGASWARGLRHSLWGGGPRGVAGAACSCLGPRGVPLGPPPSQPHPPALTARAPQAFCGISAALPLHWQPSAKTPSCRREAENNPGWKK